MHYRTAPAQNLQELCNSLSEPKLIQVGGNAAKLCQFLLGSWSRVGVVQDQWRSELPLESLKRACRSPVIGGYNLLRARR